MIDVGYANLLRAEEINRVLASHENLFAGKDLLEIGSGTGVQLRRLAAVCKSIVGIEIPESAYGKERQTAILEYDGRHIPFPDASFDVVFSSNVIEHIKDEQTIHNETRRVLRPDGVALHIVPTSAWRLWTSLVHYSVIPRKTLHKLHPKNGDPSSANHVPWTSRLLNVLLAERHGEFGNRLTEFFQFTKEAWRNRFESHGWRVTAVEPLGLAYSGYSLFANRLSIRARSRSAHILGSSTVLFVLRPCEKRSSE